MWTKEKYVEQYKEKIYNHLDYLTQGDLKEYLDEYSDKEVDEFKLKESYNKIDKDVRNYLDEMILLNLEVKSERVKELVEECDNADEGTVEDSYDELETSINEVIDISLGSMDYLMNKNYINEYLNNVFLEVDVEVNYDDNKVIIWIER